MVALTPKRKMSERTKKVVNDALDFLRTDDGRQQINSAMHQANEASAKLRKASNIDPTLLHQPFTI